MSAQLPVGTNHGVAHSPVLLFVVNGSLANRDRSDVQGSIEHPNSLMSDSLPSVLRKLAAAASACRLVISFWDKKSQLVSRSKNCCPRPELRAITFPP